MFNRIAAAAIAALFWVVPASADYKSDYTAYMAAIESGDLPSALKFGEAAWRAAETELGADAVTAVLAYNYAALAGPFLPEKAIEPYDRALALTLAGHGELSPVDIEVRVAETKVRAGDSATSRERTEMLNALEVLLESHPELATTNPEAYARGWRTYAVRKLDLGRPVQARRAIDKAIETASTLDPPDRQLYVDTLIIGAITRLTSKFRDEKDVVEAVALLNRSFGLFPPQKDIDSFDRQLAMAMSWRLSINVLGANLDGSSFKTGTRLVRGDEFARSIEDAQKTTSLDSLFKWLQPQPQYCSASLAWKERKPASFPRADANRGNIGSIIIGYDLNDTGIERAVVLADFPNTGFTEAALNSMKEWRLENPPPAECRKNLIQIYSFVINS